MVIDNITTTEAFFLKANSDTKIRMIGFAPKSGEISEIIFEGYSEFLMPLTINGFEMVEKPPTNDLRDFVFLSHGTEYWVKALSIEIILEP